eukprot:1704197-Karenia_brevis.AAC.1
MWPKVEGAYQQAFNDRSPQDAWAVLSDLAEILLSDGWRGGRRRSAMASPVQCPRSSRHGDGQ